MATTTPTVWKAQFQLNSAEGTDIPQSDVAVADLGNGQFVAIYNQVDSIKSLIFDAEGNGVASLPSIAGTNATFDDPVVAALGNGGLVTAFTVIGNSGATYIGAVVYDGALNGTSVIVALPSGENPASDDDVSRPSLAARDDGSFIVTYIRQRDGDGTFDVVAKTVVDGQPSEEVLIYNSDKTIQTSAEVAALDGGNAVIAYQQNFTGGLDSDPRIRIVDSDLDLIFDDFVDFGADLATDVQVAALEGGRFVVVWQTENDGSGTGIKARVYFNNGDTVSDVFVVNTTTTGAQTLPDVVALKDGGFLVTWDDGPSGSVKGQRYNSEGTKIGTEFLGSPNGSIVVSNGTSDRPATALLGDGRVVIGYEIFVNAVLDEFYDVAAAIFDPREKTINGTSGNDVLTSRLDGATVNGLGGGDTLLGQGGDDTLDGGSGLDTMKGRGGNDTYLVDNVGDFPVETADQGTDTVRSSVSYSLVDHVENLTLTGSAVSGGGNGSANVLTGHGSTNRLDGFDGNDTLLGKGGGDFLYGGNDDDRVNGGEGADELTGGAGRDSFVFDAAVNSKSVAAANADVITDFNPADDTIELAASMFPKLKAGVLTAKSFDSGKKKPAKDKHLVYYDEKKGGLWYDANGKEQKGKGDVLIATLDKGLDLTAADILIA